jgi:hypothetical protein
VTLIAWFTILFEDSPHRRLLNAQNRRWPIRHRIAADHCGAAQGKVSVAVDYVPTRLPGDLDWSISYTASSRQRRAKNTHDIRVKIANEWVKQPPASFVEFV